MRQLSSVSSNNPWERNISRSIATGFRRITLVRVRNKGESVGLFGGRRRSRVTSDLELRQSVTDLQAALRNQEVMNQAKISRTTQDQVDEALLLLAQPGVYMATQLAIIQRGRAVSAVDIAEVIQMVLSAIERLGGTFIGEPFSLAPYDPKIHLEPAAGLEIGKTVTIQVPGLASPTGRTLRRALVTIP